MDQPLIMEDKNDHVTVKQEEVQAGEGGQTV